MADETVDYKGRTPLKLEPLYTGNKFVFTDALVVPQFSDDVRTLPHSVDVSALEHFKGTSVPVALDRKRIYVLIGQSVKELLIVLEKGEGASPEEPTYVLTRLGPCCHIGFLVCSACASGLL